MEIIEPNLNVDLEKERRRADEFENDYKSLKIKYDNVCERIRIATHQLEHVQIVLEETSRRCEQLEKEKLNMQMILIGRPAKFTLVNTTSSDYIRQKFRRKLYIFEEQCELISYLAEKTTVHYKPSEKRTLEYNVKYETFFALRQNVPTLNWLTSKQKETEKNICFMP
ncbi:unnamed protein product [Rotaria sp. Silwood1]|nr:unnamed protein product [Rotaria sp. Silwood1]